MKDYAKTRKQRQRVPMKKKVPQTPNPKKRLKLVIVLTAVCLALAASGYFVKPWVGAKLEAHRAQKIAEKQSKAEAKKQKAEAAVKKAEALKPREPKFTFYDALPESKVQVEVTKQASTLVDDGKRYVLQVASYRDEDQAQSVLKLLNKNGLIANINEVEGSRGTWYQVRLGEVETLRETDKQKHKLQDLGFNSSFVRTIFKD